MMNLFRQDDVKQACGQCIKQFTLKSNLRKHVEGVHLSIRE